MVQQHCRQWLLLDAAMLGPLLLWLNATMEPRLAVKNIRPQDDAGNNRRLLNAIDWELSS